MDWLVLFVVLCFVFLSSSLGSFESVVASREHALLGERHDPGHHHQPARLSLPHDHRHAHRMNGRQSWSSARYSVTEMACRDEDWKGEEVRRIERERITS